LGQDLQLLKTVYIPTHVYRHKDKWHDSVYKDIAESGMQTITTKRDNSAVELD